MNDETIIRECELQFQSGGPRVCIIDRIRWSVRPTSHTAKKAVYFNDSPTIEIWARRKQRGVRRYEWKKVN